MIRLRSQLGQRALRILDTRRALSTHVSRELAGFAVTATLALTGFVATLVIGLPAQAVDPAHKNAESASAASAESFRSDPSNAIHTYEGQVLLPNGEPAAGADIYLVHYLPTPLKRIDIKPITQTGADGYFRFESANNSYGETETIVAKMTGYAFGWAIAAALDARGLPAHLRDIPDNHGLLRALALDQGPVRLNPDDTVVRGRVLNSQGVGIPDVTITVTGVWGGPDHTSAAWDEVVRSPQADLIKFQTVMVRELRGPLVSGLFSEIRTDADGKFELPGIGTNRIAKLVLQGAGIVAESIAVSTNGGETVVLPVSGAHDGVFDWTFYGPNFTHLAEPSRPVEGQVTDEQGQGIAGVIITSVRGGTTTIESNNQVTRRTGSDDVIAITDTEGRYRLDGLPAASKNILRLTSPSGTDFLPIGGWVDTDKSNDIELPNSPIKADFTLKRGIVVAGKVVDSVTRNGVRGTIRFQERKDPSANMFMSYSVSASSIAYTKLDGTFRTVVPRSAGWLVFDGSDRDKYRLKGGQNLKPAEGIVEVSGDGERLQHSTHVPPNHAMLFIQGNESSLTEVKLDVERASRKVGQAITSDGEILSNFSYTGRGPQARGWFPSTQGTMELFDLESVAPRRVVVIQRERQLSGTDTIDPGDSQFELTLHPWGIVKGRLIDRDGKPLAGVTITSMSYLPRRVFASPTEALEEPTKDQEPLPLPPQASPHQENYIVTDESGRFKIDGMVAGEIYNLVGESRQISSGMPISGIITLGMVIQPGQTLDLGDVRLMP